MVNDMVNDGLPCFTGDLIEELSINNDPRHLGDWSKDCSFPMKKRSDFCASGRRPIIGQTNYQNHDHVTIAFTRKHQKTKCTL